jgi:hypothetical protein
MKVAEKINSKEIVDEILRMPRGIQAKEIEKHSQDKTFLKEFAATLLLLAEEQGYKSGGT